MATEAAPADDSSAAAEEAATGGDKQASDEKEAPAGNAIAALAEAAQAAALASPSVETTLAVHFFGRNGRDIVTEQDFLTCVLQHLLALQLHPCNIANVFSSYLDSSRTCRRKSSSVSSSSLHHSLNAVNSPSRFPPNSITKTPRRIIITRMATFRGGIFISTCLLYGTTGLYILCCNVVVSE